MIGDMKHLGGLEEERTLKSAYIQPSAVFLKMQSNTSIVSSGVIIQYGMGMQHV